MTEAITLKNGSTVGTGTWLDGHMGWHNTYRIIDIAESHGFAMGDEDRKALEWYKESSGGCGDGTDAEENMAEAIIGQGGLSDRASDHMEELLPDGWTLLWDAGELSLVRNYVACAFHGGGCDVDFDYRDDREIVHPCMDHRPDFKIKVELQRTDGHWFSYRIALRDEAEDLVPLASTSVTFEASGLDNLKVEGDHWHPSTIGSKDVREAAERLVAEYESSNEAKA
ncbi:hypothetical protein ACFW2V_13470 [Streptomyces sp. NPDC058947]|uniref:hypothetical protein n=1 Tax=Streptomyces sp. NPDC058947 TaxID=3346675 RepID=UPI003685885B